MIWNILNQNSDYQLLNEQQILDILLANRGLKNQLDIDSFLSPIDPRKISLNKLGLESSKIKQVINLLKNITKTRSKVVVYGDYDADGVLSTAIMWELLHKLGVDAMPYIPDRFVDGYGMKVEAVKKLQSKYSNLGMIVTVDQGIVAHQAIEYCKQNQIKIILTDHHQAQDGFPDADLIFHNTEISGSALAWWLAKEIIKEFNINNHQNLVDSWLELAAIGTVTDVMELKDLNRSIVSFGLKLIRNTRREGLLQLMHLASVSPEQLECYHFGFLIGPRLNAMGRIEHALDALRLICTKDKIRAKKLAQVLDQTNQQRQQLTREILEVALKQAKQQSKDHLLVISGQDFPEGIVGLVAGKLTDRFNKPAIVLTEMEDCYKGSARSIESFNIFQALTKDKELMMAVGGHPMAAGLTISRKNFPTWVESIKNFAQNHITEAELQPKLKIEQLTNFSQITDHLYQLINQLAPFGNGNRKPIFACEDCKIQEFRLVGKENQHLKLTLSKDQINLSAIFFGGADFYPQLKLGKNISIAFQISENNWKNQKNLQLILKDIHI